MLVFAINILNPYYISKYEKGTFECLKEIESLTVELVIFKLQICDPYVKHDNAA